MVEISLYMRAYTVSALVCATQKTEIIQPNKTMSRTKKYFSKEAKEKMWQLYAAMMS